MIRFSIIVPTLGRPSLDRMLESITSQALVEGDEIIMVAERLEWRMDLFQRHCASAKPGSLWYGAVASDAPGGYGNPQRNVGLTLCRGDYINYQDDDDVMAPGILAVMRANCEAQPGKIFIYQMRWPDGHLNPGYPPRDLAGGQCFVWPNIPGRMGKFGHRYAGDQDFMEQTIALHPEGKAGVIYRPEVITEYAGCHEKR